MGRKKHEQEEKKTLHRFLKNCLGIKVIYMYVYKYGLIFFVTFPLIKHRTSYFLQDAQDNFSESLTSTELPNFDYKQMKLSGSINFK